mmetsp:Transcript_52060/g.110624  ORF Transcript_52060/g.110624 Transcript_52060/m.110624 type:complete len:272 (+) Transcript_52060:1196-2011(+)
MYWAKQSSRVESKRLRNLRTVWSSTVLSSLSSSIALSIRSSSSTTRFSLTWTECVNQAMTQSKNSRPSPTDFPIAPSTSGLSITLCSAVSSSALRRMSTGLLALRRLLSPSVTKLHNSSSWLTLFRSSKKTDRSHFLLRILSLFRLRKMEYSESASGASGASVPSSVREVLSDEGLLVSRAPDAGVFFFADERRLDRTLVKSEPEAGSTLTADVAMVESSEDMSSTTRLRSSTTTFRSCAFDSGIRAWSPSQRLTRERAVLSRMRSSDDER